ncbi:Protein phosphatase 2C-like protein 1 [Yarrowia sp. B02]|nr:Protein phosphatase 2C-like protein 1 [Yarrowia sp. B02]
MRGVSTSDLLVRRSPSSSAGNSQTSVAERQRSSSDQAKKIQLPTVSTHPPPDTPVNHANLNLTHASSAIQNTDFRSRMNDCHDVHVSESRAFFGVYDGHGGDATALWAKAKLRPLIYAALGAAHEKPVGNKPRPSMYARAMSVSQSVVTDTTNTSSAPNVNASNMANANTPNANNLQVPGGGPAQPRYYTPDLSLRISAAFYKLNEWIVSRSGYSLGGACATVAYIEHTQRESLAQSSNTHDGSMITRLVVANVGDCVCIMSHKGRAQRMTAEHTLSAPSERERIVASGGLITHKKVDGLHRVTRSLGDKSFKRYISSQPFVSDTVLGAADEFIILASNGLWDVVDDQTCVDLIRHIDDCKVASDTLVSYALKHGAADNVTVVVVRFVSSDMCREYPQLGETASIVSSEGDNRRLLSTRRAFSQSGYVPAPGLATLNESKRVHDRVARFNMFETLTRTHDAIFDNKENYNVIMAAAEMSLKLRGRVGPLNSSSLDRMPERMSSDRMNSIVSMGTVSSCSPRSSLTYSDDESTPATSMAKRPSISSSSSSGSSFNRRSQYMRSRSQVSGIATFEQLEEMEELDRLRNVNYSGLAQPGDLRTITDTESAIEEDDDEVLEEVDTQLEELPRNKKVLFAASTRSQRSSASTLEVARTHSTASTASSSATVDDDTVAERFTSMFNNSRPARKMSRALENISFEPRRASFEEKERNFDSNSSPSEGNTPSGTPSASQSFISLQRELRDKAHVASHHAASAASGLRHSHLGGTFFPEHHHHHKKSNSVAIPSPEKGGSGSNSREGSKERSFSVQLGHAPHHISHLLHGSKTRL